MLAVSQQPSSRPSGRPAVLLLHSSGSTGRQWEALVEMLRPNFRAIPIDLHGHGVQPDWSGDTRFTLADDAALVGPMLRRLGAAHVVGHSYGGAVALKAATLYPDRVLSVTTYEPPLFRALVDDPHSGVERQEILAVAEIMGVLVAKGRPEEAARRFVEYWSGAKAWDRLPSSSQAAIAARMPSVLRHFDALLGEPFALRELGTKPMLFLTGAKTVNSTRRIAELLRSTFPGASHEVLPEMSHMGPITHASAVNRRIEQFLH